MKRLSISLAVLALVALGAASAFAEDSAAASASQESPQKIVVHLSHFTDDLHRCFMALKVGGLMQEMGAEVTLFLDLEGVRLAERRQLLDMTWGSDTTPLAKHYEKFTEAGGKVLLCPHCAHSARIGEGALKRHAEVATEQMLGKMLLEADKILDY